MYTDGSLTASAIMANPRKFSEKIALQQQKQAEETAAFEAILREVSATTKPSSSKLKTPVQPPPPQQVPQIQGQNVHLAQPILGAYRAGSLPNVNQMVGSNTIDLQNALQGLEDIKHPSGRQSLVDRFNKDRSPRNTPTTHRNSNSRGHTSPFEKRIDCSPYGSAYLSPPPSDSNWRRSTSDSALHTSVMQPQQQQQQDQQPPQPPPAHSQNANSRQEPLASIDGATLKVEQQWDPKVQQMLLLSRPKSAEVPGINIYPSPDQLGASSQPVPIPNNTGSLPDLTTLNCPLATPLDTEDPQQPYMMLPQQQPKTQPAPLNLGRPQDIDLSRYAMAHSWHNRRSCSPQLQPSPSPDAMHLLSVDTQTVPQQPALSQYRTSTSDCPQSPTSPLSQPSFSPSQSPGLPPSTIANNVFTDAYFLQQQNALQHQFECFNMDPTLSNGGLYSLQQPGQPPGPDVGIRQLSQQPFPSPPPDVFRSNNSSSNHCFFPSPSSPQHAPQQQQKQSSSPSPATPVSSQDLLSSSAPAPSRIPDIILTGVDEHLSLKNHDFAKEISNAMAGMTDSIDSDLFPVDEAIKAGLEPLDLDGLQMLTDSSLVADPATEDSFRLDRLS